MKFAIRPILDVEDVNDFQYGVVIEGVHGNALDCFVQLVNAEKNLERYGFSPPGLRYIPAVGSTLEVHVLNVDRCKSFRRFATNPFPQDTSIWKFSLLPTDPLSCTVSLKFVLTDGTGANAVVHTCHSNGLLRIQNYQGPRQEPDYEW